MSTTLTIPEAVAETVGAGLGRHVIAPAIAGAIDAPDVQAAIARTVLRSALLAGLGLGASALLVYLVIRVTR